MDVLDEMFAAMRADNDSVPFEHETFGTDRVGEPRTEDTR